MKRIVRPEALAIAALLAGSAIASAAPITLASWNFNELGTTYAATNGPWVQSVSAPEATVTAMTDNSLDHLQADDTRDTSPGGIGTPGLLLGLGSTGVAATPDPNVPGAPVSTVDYLIFDVTANQNNLSLTSLSFKLGQSVAAAQQTGTISQNATYVQVFYSTDGTNFSAVGAQQQAILNIADGAAKFSGMQIYTVDLSSIASVNSGQSVNFRVGITDNRGGGSTSMASYWDDFQLEGDVAIPEPSSLTLLGLAAAGLMTRRRISRPSWI